MVDIASLEESGLVLSMEAFSFTYELEAMSKDGMGVIGRCGCVGEVDSRTEWVWGRDVMDSVCETDDGSADGTDDGSANECANDDSSNDATDNTSNNSANDFSNNTSNDAPHTNPNNNPSHNDSNGNANCSTPHI